MLRKSIAIAACMLGTSVAAHATAGPVFQVTGNLTGVIQTVKNEIGKQAGLPHVFPVPATKSISLSINALVNLAQGFPINAAPVKNVTLGYSCGTDTFVVVTKIPGAKPQPSSPVVTLTTPYITVSGIIEPSQNGITNPVVDTTNLFIDEQIFTPTGAAPNSFPENKDYIGLEAIPDPAFGVPSVGTAPTGIQPLIGAVKYTFYTGDFNKAPTVTVQCGNLKSLSMTNLHGAIVAKPDGATTTLIVITGGSLGFGNTLLGYH